MKLRLTCFIVKLYPAHFTNAQICTYKVKKKNPNISKTVQWKKKVKSHPLTLHQISVFKINILRKMTVENIM
jgi:hypothetical protein